MRKRTLCAVLTVGPTLVGAFTACLALAALALLIACNGLMVRIIDRVAASSTSMVDFLEDSARALESRRAR